MRRLRELAGGAYAERVLRDITMVVGGFNAVNWLYRVRCAKEC